MITKLMGLASIGSSLVNVSLLYRFLEGIIGLIALTIVSAMMAGVLVVSCFYGAYVGMTRYGMDPDAALIAIIGLALVLTLALVSLTISRLKHLQSLPEMIMPRMQMPLTGTVTHVARLAQAFLEGFKARPH